MTQSPAGKGDLVTGASRGIGAAIAKRLAREGADVAITYARDDSVAAAVVAEVRNLGRNAIAIRADAASVEASVDAVEQTIKTFGRLDILVNNAGTAIPRPFAESTIEEMNRPIDTDLNPANSDWAVPQLANTALNRYGTAGEVAALVAFLAGPEAAYITGANLTVDGGTNA